MTENIKYKWEARTTNLDPSRTKFQIFRDQTEATFQNVLDAWCGDDGFCNLFNKWLVDSEFDAFRWETPSVTSNNVAQQPFEFVLVDSMGLGRNPDRDAFKEYFTDDVNDVVTFPNLGGDAILVVPKPIPNVSLHAYGHLAAYVRAAPESQRRSLWQFVGHAMKQRLSQKKVWLSTAGAGVSWLHVRLDSRPKYYNYEPFRQT